MKKEALLMTHQSFLQVIVFLLELKQQVAAFFVGTGWLVLWLVLLFKPKYRLGHPKHCQFSLSKNTFSVSKYPKYI